MNLLLLLFAGSMLIISFRYSDSLIDWWEALVYGKQMNTVSLIYLLSLTGTVICVFMNYFKK